jgi:hypothetical protein
MKLGAIAATWVWVALALPAYAFASFDAASGELGPASQAGVQSGVITASGDEAASPSAPGMCSDALPARAPLLTRAEHVAGVQPVREAREPRESDDQPAWCISADDPRCAPRDASGAPDVSRGQAPLPAAAEFSLPRPHGVPPAPTLRAVQLGAPRSGSHVRLERPPRPACA